MHQFDLLTGVGEIRCSGDIATRPSQARDQPGTDWITCVHHYDRNRVGGLARSPAGGGRWRNDRIDLERRELARECV